MGSNPAKRELGEHGESYVHLPDFRSHRVRFADTPSWDVSLMPADETVIGPVPLRQRRQSPTPHRRNGQIQAVVSSDRESARSDGLGIVEKGLGWMAILFLLSIIIPWNIDIGPLRTSVARIILMVTVVPSLVMWLSGRAGRIRIPDLAVILFCLWCFASFAVVDGVDASIQSGGMMLVETAGTFFLARICVRNARQFYQMILTVFLTVMFLLPFAIYETLSGRDYLLELFSSVLPSHAEVFMEPRWGLRRVQTVFDHPILFGVFCSFIFTFTHMILGQSLSARRRWLMSALAAAATLLSLSSGPISALSMQIFLIFWNWSLGSVPGRWWMLTGLFAAMYLTVSIFSNQTFFEFYVHYFAFSQDTGWDRLRIWHYGWISVFNHPLFGIGYHDYERPDWMQASIDMFWLINFVRFGFIGGLAILVAFWWTFFSVALKKGLVGTQALYRTTFVISMMGVFTVGWTVHFWNAVYLLFMFLLGSASWMLDVPEPAPDRLQHVSDSKPRSAPRVRQRIGGGRHAI